MSTAEAYQACREITRREARNFYYGFVLLPAQRREAIYAAYAFSRRCDDSVDGDEPLDEKLVALDRRREELARCYAGDPPADDPVLVALSDAVRRFAIPRTHLEHLLEGVEWDLQVARYPDFAALEEYCDRVAGAVGLVSLHVFGFTDVAAPRHARDLGVALQLVNIMRDVAEDAGRGRIYLPQDELRAHGVSEKEVLEGLSSERFQALMATQGARARRYFARGEQLLPLLDRRARMCVAILAGLYREILTSIESRDYDVFGERVALSTGRKLSVMGHETLASLATR